MDRLTYPALWLAVFCGHAAAVAQDAELQQFKGNWDVTQLVENGKVIPPEAIRNALPSGGKLEVIDNAIVFRSADNQQLRARTFTIDATKYPRTIDLRTGDTIDAHGIYRFDEGRLVICASPPNEAERPGDFSAPEGSQRMLLVLERAKPGSSKPEAPRTAQATERDATTASEASRKSLVGVWRYEDSAGALIVRLNADGSYSTTREVKEARLFSTVFVNTPISNGTWTVENGQLLFHVTGANNPNRLNRTSGFTIRSVSPGDFIFVDALGRVAKATRLK